MFSNKKSFWLPQPGAVTKLPTKIPSGSPSLITVESVLPTIRPDFPAGVYHKLFDKKSFHMVQLGSIPKLPTKRHCFDPSSHPSTAQEKIHHNTPATLPLQIHIQQIPFHTPQLPPILFSQHHSLQSPHPYSISHIAYTSPPWRPHRSHCTCIQGQIQLPGPLQYAAVYPVMCWC